LSTEEDCKIIHSGTNSSTNC